MKHDGNVYHPETGMWLASAKVGKLTRIDGTVYRLEGERVLCDDGAVLSYLSTFSGKSHGSGSLATKVRDNSMRELFLLFQASPRSLEEAEIQTISPYRMMIVYAVIGIAAMTALARWNTSDQNLRDCGVFTIGVSSIGGCDRIGR